MTIAGWIVMGIACGGTLLWFAWCLARLLRRDDGSDEGA